MKKLITTIFIVIFVLLFNFCNNINSREADTGSNYKQTQIIENKDNAYLILHAGMYNIYTANSNILHNGIEHYLLYKNGKAVWLWIPFYPNCKIYTSEKLGTWTATKKSLTIEIKGNTGLIIETYILSRNNTFVHKTTPGRCLKLNYKY